MKQNHSNGMWKIIIFLAAILLSFSFPSCTYTYEPEDQNPKISLTGAEDVTESSAVLVASLSPKGKNIFVLFQYFDNGDWQPLTIDPYSGDQTLIIKKKVSGLEMNKTYQFRVIALAPCADNPDAYRPLETTEAKEFKTLNKPIVKIKEIKYTRTTIDLKIGLVPKCDKTKVQLEYVVNGTALIKTADSLYGGQSEIEINFHLDNLEKNTSYPIKIKVLNDLGLEKDTILKTCAVSDYDGNTYHIVTIGIQVWLQENFRGTHYANGDPIPNVTNPDKWVNMMTEAYCWYNNDPKLGEIYGGLYNFYAAHDSRGFIIGFHIPSASEWTTLANYLGGTDVAGGKMKEAGSAHWIQPNTGATNSSGFNGLPSGDQWDTSCDLGRMTIFWSDDIYPIPLLTNKSSDLTLNVMGMYFGGYSIRLVQN